MYIILIKYILMHYELCIMDINYYKLLIVI